MVFERLLLVPLETIGPESSTQPLRMQKAGLPVPPPAALPQQPAAAVVVAWLEWRDVQYLVTYLVTPATLCPV